MLTLNLCVGRHVVTNGKAFFNSWSMCWNRQLSFLFATGWIFSLSILSPKVQPLEALAFGRGLNYNFPPWVPTDCFFLPLDLYFWTWKTLFHRRHVWLSQLEEGVAIGISWVEAKISAKHSTMHRTGLTPTKNNPAQNINGATTEKLWYRSWRCMCK